MRTLKRTMRFICLMILACAVAVTACACGSGDGGATETEPTPAVGVDNSKGADDQGDNETPEITETPDIAEPTQEPEKPDAHKTDLKSAAPGEVILGFFEDGTYAYSDTQAFFDATLTVKIDAPAGAKVYYTLDCKEPTEDSQLYSEPIVLEPVEGTLPDAYVLRAKALLPSGTWSTTAAKTYFVAENVKERYTTLVFSVTGDPDDLTNKPNGIFYGRNYKKRGRESERVAYIEAYGPDGFPEFSQFGGVRIYGGYSRQNSIKSMKLFARKEYDPERGTFKFNNFGTEREDGSGKVVNKYDKLVLRDAGNDYQFCFLRDELSQTLVKKAGFDFYEGVLPATTYLNGKYYGLLWLHESYCDTYFKERFGKDAPGEFVVLEGSDQKKKDDDDDELTQKCVEEFNREYNKFINMDLTNDANYKALNEFLVVEDYLDFFAWNISLNNWDWPNNNYKVMRYVPAEGDTYKDGVFDGRYRFLPHDMDYSYGLYGQDTTQPYYDTLRIVMNPRDTRYAPLFTKLMERDDCKEYFKNKTIEFFNGPLSEQSIIDTYNMLNESRSTELLGYYYEHMDQLRKKGDFTLWCSPQSYYDSEADILRFAKNRAEYALKYIERDLYGAQ